MAAALEGGEWSAARPGRTLPLEKTRYPFYRRLGGLQGQSGRAENLVPTGIRSRTVQPIVSNNITSYFFEIITEEAMLQSWRFGNESTVREKYYLHGCILKHFQMILHNDVCGVI